MNIEIPLPQSAMEMSPLLVTAPVERSGTTLVQRLICSSANGICYGENLFAELLDLAGYVMKKIQLHTGNRDSEEKALQSVLEGEADRWIPDLSPAYADYVYGIVSIFYVLPRFTDQYSSSIGRPVWGVKRPSLNSEETQSLMSLLPKAKIVYVYRNIFDCARSAKARKFITDDQGLVRIAQQWRVNLSAALDIPQGDGFFLLKYEDLVADPAGEIVRLEEATGLSGVNSKVMDLKVNTWSNQSSEQYVPPCDLDDHETDIIKGVAGDLIDRLYP